MDKKEKYYLVRTAGCYMHSSDDFETISENELLKNAELINSEYVTIYKEVDKKKLLKQYNIANKRKTLKQHKQEKLEKLQLALAHNLRVHRYSGPNREASVFRKETEKKIKALKLEIKEL